MELNLNLLWVLIVIMIGLGLSIYSVCKGWSTIPERGMTANTFAAPYVNALRNVRAERERQRQANINTVSLQVDKNPPPTYDEIFSAVPPTYEETLKMFEQKKKCNNNLTTVIPNVHRPSSASSGNSPNDVVIIT